MQSPERTDPPEEASTAPRLGGALTAAYATPGGAATAARGDDLAKTLGSLWVLGAGAGVRFGPRWYVGAYGSYGLGEAASQIRSACSQAGVSCSTSMYELGLEAAAHLTLQSSYDWWVSVGSGLEQSTLRAAGDAIHIGGLGLRSQTGLQFGTFGVFAGLNVGRYSYQTDQTNTGRDVGIAHAATHTWLSIGLRLAR